MRKKDRDCFYLVRILKHEHSASPIKCFPSGKWIMAAQRGLNDRKALQETLITERLLGVRLVL